MSKEWGGMVSPEEVLELQQKHGIAPHKHTNGLMSCVECVNLVVFGETVRESGEKMARRFWESVQKDCPHDIDYPNFCEKCFPEK